jgi:hypothetical protein
MVNEEIGVLAFRGLTGHAHEHCMGRVVARGGQGCCCTARGTLASLHATITLVVAAVGDVAARVTE